MWAGSGAIVRARKRAVTGCAIKKHGSEDLPPQLYMTFNTVAVLLLLLLLCVIHLTVFCVSLTACKLNLHIPCI
jgi:hypothetical protein